MPARGPDHKAEQPMETGLENFLRGRSVADHRGQVAVYGQDFVDSGTALVAGLPAIVINDGSVEHAAYLLSDFGLIGGRIDTALVSSQNFSLDGLLR